MPDPQAAAMRIAEAIARERMIRNVLSIAGSDPPAARRIQADLKTFFRTRRLRHGGAHRSDGPEYTGVFGVHLVPAQFVADQIKTIFADVRVDAVKIGMIANARSPKRWPTA